MCKSYSKFIFRTATALLFFIFASFTSIASADKQEWKDDKYKFSTVKNILVLKPSIEEKSKNGINEYEIEAIFGDKVKLSDNIIVFSADKIGDKFKADTGVDILEVAKSNSSEGLRLFYEATSKYTDLMIMSNVLVYYYDVPNEVAHVAVKWDVKDTKTNKIVWTLIDERFKINSTKFDNTKPKDLYSRITGAFFESLNNKLSR